MNYKDHLNLEGHIEGGYFSVFFKSSNKVKPLCNRYNNTHIKRFSSSSIFFLLEKTAFSAWHRLKSDEIWHYYDGGSPIDIHIIDNKGHYSNLVLGNPSIIIGAKFQQVVKAGYWFAAEVRNKDSFGLVGCTVSPAFEYEDFELAEPMQEELKSKHPKLVKQIDRFINSKDKAVKPKTFFHNNALYYKQKSSLNDYFRILGLKKHFGGGYFATNYLASDSVLPLQETVSNKEVKLHNENSRIESTSDYYLLNKNDFSAWHRLKSDEIWHFYEGSTPVKIHIIGKNGVLSTHILGSPRLTPKASFQVAIQAGDWFAVELQNKNSCSLMGRTTSPGLKKNDYELACCFSLANQYPSHKEIIMRLGFKGELINEEKETQLTPMS